MYSFTVKSKVLQILTYIRQERLNERYRNTVKGLLLPNTVNQKDEKPHTAGLDDTAIPHIKIKTTEIPLEKKLNTVNPYVHSIIATAAKNVKKHVGEFPWNSGITGDRTQVRKQNSHAHAREFQVVVVVQ